MEAAVTQDKVDAFVKDHPDYFDGTTVHVGHIMVACEPMEGTATRLEKRKKLQKILDDLHNGTPFNDAVKQSESYQTDLGEVKNKKFRELIPSFAAVAFSLKKGETSGIFRTEKGFHIIKIIDRMPGKETPAPDAAQIARRILKEQLAAKVNDLAMTQEGKIVYFQKQE